jgi:pilus assembly protein CpaB
MRTILTIAASVFLGLVAVILLRMSIGSPRPPQLPVMKGVPVVVAAETIARGATLTPTLLKVVEFPPTAVPAGAFEAVAQVTGAGPAAREALRSIVPGEPVLASKISEPGVKSDLSLAVHAGMRAISLRSNDVAGVAGFVLPGDRVDVLLTRASSAGGKDEVSETQALAQNILVLAADQEDSDETNKPVVAKSITLEVTPAQAQSISLAQSVGAVSLALRHAGDDANSARPVTFLSDFAPAAPRPAHVVRKARLEPSGPSDMFQVRVTRGVQAVSYDVSRP